MSVQTIRWRYRAWRYRYRLERHEIRQVLSYLRAGDMAVDVGAHKGGYTWWMRRAVGKGGHVIAFEPQVELAANLASVIRASGYDNVTVENRALSAKPGTLTLNVPGPGTSPGASLENRSPTPAGQSYPVDVTTLDAYFASGRGARIKLIKCDAEGHELEVFRGGERLLTQTRPVLLFECERRHRGGGRVQDVFDFLADLGFEGFFIAGDGPHALDGFDPDVHQADSEKPDYVNNFLFIDPQRHEAPV